MNWLSWLPFSRSKNELTVSKQALVELEESLKREIICEANAMKRMKGIAPFLVEAYRQVAENLKFYLNMFIILNVGIASALFGADCVTQARTTSMYIFILAAILACIGGISLTHEAKKDFIDLCECVKDDKTFLGVINKIQEKYSKDFNRCNIMIIFSFFLSCCAIAHLITNGF